MDLSLLFISVLRAGQRPLVLSRALSERGKKALANYERVCAENQSSIAADTSAPLTEDVKSQWWKRRFANDDAVRQALDEVEQEVLGWTRVCLCLSLRLFLQ